MQIVRDITTISEDVVNPVTLTEAKNYLRVDYSEDDDLIESLITTARVRLEQYAGVAMTERTLQVVAYVDNFIELPYVPIGTVLTVEVFAGNDWVELTENMGYYLVGSTYVKTFMTSYLSSEFRFTYTCGYASTPQIMKTALLKMVSDLYEYRESSVEATRPSANLMTAYELIRPFKRINIIF